MTFRMQFVRDRLCDRFLGPMHYSRPWSAVRQHVTLSKRRLQNHGHALKNEVHSDWPHLQRLLFLKFFHLNNENT